ncbi:MAG: Holliday junction resolvase RuvX [Sedimentisphaerales bacterium]|nr:Holliday junction resolvase RuvX [Sedimentisphaerales bacterium]
MRYLAIDYGMSRVGLALCDPDETIVSPLCQLPHQKSQPQRLVVQIKEIIRQYQIDAVVVGLPINMDGSEGDQAKITRKFAMQLGRNIELPVYYQNEQLSSAAADEMMAQSGLSVKKRKARRDMLAACDILNEFLNKQSDGGRTNRTDSQ